MSRGDAQSEGLARRTVINEISAHTLVKRPVLMEYLIRSNTTESDLRKWLISHVSRGHQRP